MNSSDYWFLSANGMISAYCLWSLYVQIRKINKRKYDYCDELEESYEHKQMFKMFYGNCEKYDYWDELEERYELALDYEKYKS